MQAVCSHGTCLAAAVAPEKLQVVAACRREAGSCGLPPGPHASPWATANPPHPPCHRPVVQGARPAAGGRAGGGGQLSLERSKRDGKQGLLCFFRKEAFWLQQSGSLGPPGQEAPRPHPRPGPGQHF